MVALLDPRPPEQWLQILENTHRSITPTVDGADYETAMAARILGDIQGYEHPTGSQATRERREKIKHRDIAELANALRAYGTLRVQERGLGE
jgi:hypothetical protein